MTLDERAVALARAQRPLRRQPARSVPLFDQRSVTAAIARATRAFRSPRPDDPEYPTAAEWFLDNHYLVARTLRQVTTEIPKAFECRFPYVGEEREPRILGVARALVEATRLELDEAALLAFVEAYQREASLTIAELWALPAMLRIATLEPLARVVASFFEPTKEDDGWESMVPRGLRVERAVQTLRLLSDLDWRAFIQKTSAVEAALRDDPLGVYVRMDFDARDTYRKVVESLAWDTGRPEPEVARMAVGLAEVARAARPPLDLRQGHVGYYLVDEGRRLLEARLDHRLHGLDRVRNALLAHPTLGYLGSIAFGSFWLLAATALVAARWSETRPVAIAVACALLVVPVSSIALGLTNWVVNRLIAPRILPKLDFSHGIPTDCRTAVVIPALVERTSDFDRLFARLELHYLSCSDPSLIFALLTDHVDAPVLPDDTELLAHARTVVEALNAKYGKGTQAPFHVLHRTSRWNEGERCFMGWERKRGKLDELNRLLRGSHETSFDHHLGDATALLGIRFVITLDADTQLPLGAARKLVGLAAHPLNTAYFDASSGRVTAGYTVVQPRVEASPIEAHSSLFSRLWSGDTALDIYASAASDVYQDVFGSGAYVGKGIYEIDPFTRSVAGLVPLDSLASHDLFEGIHGRAALATDIALFEQYPSDYLSYARRMHRWIRGDWQLVPWLWPRVPSASGLWIPNRLTFIDRWKVSDNLRRSLLSPSLLALFFCLLFSSRASGIAASMMLLVPLGLPLLVSAPAFLDGNRRQTLGRWALGVVFLPHEAWIAVDAILRVLVRISITRKHLLQWVTAADSARKFAHGSRSMFWREMGPAAIVSAAVGVVGIVLRPALLPFAAPVLLLWLLSPEIARYSSRRAVVEKELSPEERRTLRHLARRTWLFFETFVGPGDQWLPPDNFQEPGAVTAHRTSPTNIGLMFVADLCAFDLGYIGRAELAALVQQSLDSVLRLERYRGHWLNWYDTRTLAPLLPRYVSTVDSGNLAAALLTLAQGCREAAHGPSVRPARFVGLGDTLELLELSVRALAAPHAATTESVAAIRRALGGAIDGETTSDAAVHTLSAVEVPALERALLELLERTTPSLDVTRFREVQTWLDRLRHQIRSIQGDIDARERQNALRDELLTLAARVDAARADIDFSFLFDSDRKLFRIGYDATSDRLDANYYDLLASEARLASFLAIVFGQVPPEHWLTLGRPVTLVHGEAALLSWGGTMFEYLMPTLLMRSEERTLLQQSAELAVIRQIDLGRQAGTPWGVSESGYAQRDAQRNYQYRSFGAPGLGLRRGLVEDHVIAPYASVLAVSVRPAEVVENLAAFERLGARGLYGLYEAVDYDEGRALEASRAAGEAVKEHAIVRSHMAHHQGMILAALDNALHADVLVRRFHDDPVVRTGALLLSERLPSVRVAEALPPPRELTVAAVADTPVFPKWTPGRSAPQLALLGNGRLTTVVTDTGAGFTSWNGLAVTRGGVDAACDTDGTFLYVRDETRAQVWSAAPAPTRARLVTDEVLFSAHQVSFHHRDEGISIRTEIALAASDDIEIRNITLHNETDQPRTLVVMSYAEPVLEPTEAAARQPAFSRMFVECETLPGQHAIVASRRTRSAAAPAVFAMQSMVWDDPAVSWAGSQTDRRAFVGRRHDVRSPTCTLIAPGEDAPGTATLDPVMVLAVRIVLAPRARVTVALVTAVAPSREAVLDLARRFASIHALGWAVHDASRELARRLTRESMSPSLLPHAMEVFSRLLLPSAALLAARPSLPASYPSQSSLWGHGISGDHPLLVVRVASRDNPMIVEQVLATYRFLRSRGVLVETVFLDEVSSGYRWEEPGSVRGLLMKAGAAALLDQRGGIFVLATDQLNHEYSERIRLAARVLIDSESSLAAQVSRNPAVAPALPLFSPARAPDAEGAARSVALPALGFDNAFGGFTADGREYVIRARRDRPTPAPWCNVLANSEAGCLVSESALGATWTLNSGENRLTPWRNDPVSDAPSEVLYLRDEETAEVWSSTPLPAGLDVDTVVRHGAGYTHYERESHGLAQRLTVFVPPSGPVKIVRLTLTNRLPRTRRLTATYYVEWVLGVLRDTERSHVVCELDATTRTVLARSRWNADFAERVAFLTADRLPHGITCDRTEFVGRSGSAGRPEALGRWGLSGTVEGGGDPCAALQIHIELAAGETIETHFVLGQGRDEAEALTLATRFQKPSEVDAAWRALHEHWDELLGAVQVKTPEPAMDLLLNRWLLYQSLSSRLLARTAFYQSSGAFGYRDQLQDVMALVTSAPALARAHVLTCAAHQFEEGDVLHWWHPPGDRGVRTRCSDDLAWLPFVTAHYVAATGDDGVLDELVPFLVAPVLAPGEHDRYAQFLPDPSKKPGTLFEHCQRALIRAATKGAHGLPLMGDGDWNDGMNDVGAQGRGESVWLGFFLAAAMNDFASLCDRRDDRANAARWRVAAHAIGVAIDGSAWDGDWYLRAFFDDGTPLGGKQSEMCKIDSIAQSWSVLAGVTDPARAARALASADALLVKDDDRLVLVLEPPFDEAALKNPGYIKAYPPGVRENGGQYTHAATWLGFAHAKAGDGAAAERVFRLLDPISHALSSSDVERYRVEPYVLAGDVYGASPFVGRGGWTWYTGAAAWMWRLGVEEILGLKMEAGGLRVDPCIPPHWPGFEATVRFGDQECHVVVDNQHRSGGGVLSVTLDGVSIEQPVVAPSKGPARRELRIVLDATAKAAE